jgi:FkbM family methyltransferase
MLAEIIQAQRVVAAFGFRRSFATLRDLQTGASSVRFQLNGRTMRIARDANAAGTISHLLSVDKLQALAQHVDRGDEVIVDAGAHSGLFSVLALERAPSARVVAIEPNPQLLPIIEANLSGENQWDLVPKALSDKAGEVTFYRNPGATQTSALDQTSAETWGTASEPITVSATTLDQLASDFDLDHIDVLKLDIQGAEEAVLAAASKILARTSKLLVEVTFLDGNPERLLRILREQFGEPSMVQPVNSGADLLYHRRGVAGPSS